MASTSILIADLLRNYHEACAAGRKSAQTLRVYQYTLGNLRDYLANVEGVTTWEQLDPGCLRRFEIYLQDKGLAPVTIHQHHRAIRTWINWVMRERLLERDPMRNVQAPALPKRHSPRLSAEKLRQLVMMVLGTRNPERNLAIVLLMADMGLRVGEVVALDLDDVYDYDGDLRVVGKGDKERFVPLTEAASLALEKWMEVREAAVDNDALFPSERAARITDNGVGQTLRKLKKALGVRRLYPHLLRHTFANLYLAASGDLKTLQAILGHSDITTTANFYLEPDREHLQREIREHSPMSYIWKGLGA